MNEPIFLDIETRSACDLKVAGAVKYARHETTRLLCVPWKDGGEYHVWLPGLTAPPSDALTSLHLPGVSVHVGPLVPAALCRTAHRPWVGHNVMGFDRFVWSECTEGFDHVRWVDTYPLALSNGMPGGLDAIGKMLWGEGKYEAGKNALKKAMRCEGVHDCEAENVPIGLLMLVAKYAVTDVRLGADLYGLLSRESKTTPSERRVEAASHAINARGVRIDVPFTRALVRLADQSKTHAIRQIAELTEGALPDLSAVQSRAKVIGWLAENGVRLLRDGKDCLAKDLVTRYIDANKRRDDEDNGSEKNACDETDSGVSAHVNLARIVKVLELRMSALRVTGGKLDAALQCLDSVSDSHHYVRSMFVYHAAHTGRWTGRRVQVHNFPRPKEGVDFWGLVDLFNRTGGLDYDAVRETLPLDARGYDGKLLYPYLSTDDAASALLRGMFIGDPILAAADLANIEARVLAWCAGEKWLMDAFWKGNDPYMAMAERIVGPRDTWVQYPDPLTGQPLPLKKHPYRQILGKVPHLACGYQGGADAIARYAANMGHTLSDYGTSGMTMMRAYRDVHPAIAGVYVRDSDDGYPIYVGGVWRDTDAAAICTVETGGRTFACRCEFVMSSGNLVCILPSGRRLVYRKPTVHEYVGERWTKKVLSYWSPRFGRVDTYGGKLCWGRGTRIITARGIVPIERVISGDRVWDGAGWVRTDGAVCNGYKETGTWLGESVTGDHLIHDGKSWSKVIHSDEGWSKRCLASALNSVLSPSFWAGAGSIQKQTAAAYADRRAPSIPDAFSVRRLVAVSRVPARQVPTRNHITQNFVASFPTSESDPRGATDTLEWYHGAPIRTTAPMITTAGGESGCVRSGLQTDSSSFAMPSPCPTSMPPDLTWIERTTKATTNRGTYEWSRERSMPEIGGNPVYDLLNCGPRHAYTVLTDYGPVVAHNCENIVQAISRDILANSMVGLEEAGISVVLHVHDEAVANTDDLPAFMRIMTTPPEWLRDFPLSAEGSLTPRYAKGPPPGTKDTTWTNGVAA